MKFLSRLVALVHKPEIYPEAMQAYYFKLPEKIEVDWKKENGFIIGEIKDDQDNVFILKERIQKILS